MRFCEREAGWENSQFDYMYLQLSSQSGCFHWRHYHWKKQISCEPRWLIQKYRGVTCKCHQNDVVKHLGFTEDPEGKRHKFRV